MELEGKERGESRVRNIMQREAQEGVGGVEVEEDCWMVGWQMAEG